MRYIIILSIKFLSFGSVTVGGGQTNKILLLSSTGAPQNIQYV